LVNFFGSFRKAMISSSSSLASSMPATSANVTLWVFSESSFARLLPKDIALPPPTWSWRIQKTQTPTRRSIGAHCTSATRYQGSLSSGRASISTPFSRRVGTRSVSFGA